MFFKRLDPCLFGWSSWRSGSIGEFFNIRHRKASIVAAAKLLRSHAIGWCKGENLPCRPKANNIAVMFALEDGREFWTHFRNDEFQIVFGNPQEFKILH